MSVIDDVEAGLRKAPLRWLVTGAAGFIGSHLSERLLALGQKVVGLDNFSAGHKHNLPGRSEGWTFLEGDIREPLVCRAACEGVDVVLHQAALGSVPRSLEDPVRTHQSNVDGFLNILLAARDAKVRRFVYASSSSVYGDAPKLPKREGDEGRLLSPYAVSKAINETYAACFEKAYGLRTVGLRYFNVFGPRQDPNGAYAAVVPRWLASLKKGETCEINGDGSTSRDFCFVANAVQANLLAAMVEGPDVTDTVYNVSVGGRTTLNELFTLLRDRVAKKVPAVAGLQPRYKEFRAGDIQHSQADISKAQKRLGYAPTHTIEQGLDVTVEQVLR